MLVPITGRSQADIGKVKCQEHLVDVKGQQDAWRADVQLW